MTKTKTNFDIKPFLINIPKRKKEANGNYRMIDVAYLPVAARVAWFRYDNPIETGWAIRTRTELMNGEIARAKAVVVAPDGKVVATATRLCAKSAFMDYVEKAETGAIGRALALAGYGLANEPDLDEEDHLADAPVEKK